MAPKTKSKKSAGRSRSRSTSRSRRRSTSRSRQSSRTRKSKVETPSVSGDGEVKPVERETRSTSIRASRKEKLNDLKPVETEKVVEKVESNEKEVDKISYSKSAMETLTTFRRTFQTKEEIEEEIPVRMTRGRERREREAEGITITTSTTTTSSVYDSKAVPKTKNPVLGGPIFCFLLFIIIPSLSYYLTLMCSKSNCVPRVIKFPNRLTSYFDLKTYGIYIGWIIFQLMLCLLPFGRVHNGFYTRNGNRLKYRCNGFVGFLVTIFVLSSIYVAHVRWPHRIASPTYLTDHILSLMTVALIMALFVGLGFYISARLYCRSRDLNPAGNTGNFFYDAFVGHEMHPRLFKKLDVKFFTLSRLSLSTMGVMVILLFVREYERRGGWNGGASFNMPLLLVTCQQLVYVVENLYFEESLISSYAMQHEGFGILHCLTRMVWTPFVVTMPVRYVGYLSLKDSPQWSPYAYGIILIHILAFIVRRGASSQKSDFRQEPNHPAFSSMETIPSNAKNLLAGGWWGIVRHPNYMGELLLCFSWTLPCGLKMSTPWLIPIVMLFTLMGRIRMVEASCARRHGSGWHAYCEKVRSRLIPLIL